MSVVRSQLQRTTDHRQRTDPVPPSAFPNPNSAIKKMGPHRACWPGQSAYAITRVAWVDRSPREKPPPSVGDASADVDRISKSQARHFSPRPANGPIVMIGGKNSTTIFGHPGKVSRRAAEDRVQGSGFSCRLQFRNPNSAFPNPKSAITLFCLAVWGPMFWVKTQGFCPSSF